MIAQVSPAINSIDETQCSLRFASRVRTVELGVIKKAVQIKK